MRSKTAVLLSLLLAALAAAPALAAPGNELTLTATVRSVEDASPGTCTARLEVGAAPEDVLDVTASGCACVDLVAATGKRVQITARCVPALTAAGSLCRPQVERVVLGKGGAA